MARRNIIEINVRNNTYLIPANVDKLYYVLEEQKYYTIIESLVEGTEEPVYMWALEPIKVQMNDPAVIAKMSDNIETLQDIIDSKKSIRHIETKNIIYLSDKWLGQFFYIEDEDKYYEVVVEDDTTTPVTYGWKEIQTGGGSDEGIKSFSLDNEEIEPDENMNVNIDTEEIKLIGVDSNIIIYGIKKPQEWPGLKFTSQQDNSTVGYNIIYLNPREMDIDINMSTDGKTWTTWDGTEITLNNGESIYVWNKTNTLSSELGGHLNFTMSGSIAASGNCNSMINFSEQFTNGTDFFAMFSGCTALTTPPELPSTNLCDGGYKRMFEGCTALTTAPELPATQLSWDCYSSMFSGCTSLTTAPDLPAITLANRCYEAMFYGCTNLNTIKLHYTNNFDYGYFYDWVANVSPTGTLYYNGSDTSRGWYAIPEGWTVQTF